MNVRFSRMAAIGLACGTLLAANVESQAGIFGRARGGCSGGCYQNHGGCSSGGCYRGAAYAPTSRCRGGGCYSGGVVHCGQVMHGRNNCPGGVCDPAINAQANYRQGYSGQYHSGYRGVAPSAVNGRPQVGPAKPTLDRVPSANPEANGPAATGNQFAPPPSAVPPASRSPSS